MISPGDQLAGWHNETVTVAHHLRFGRGQLAQGRQGLLGAALLEHAQGRIQDDNGHDGGGLFQVAEGGRNDGGHDQHDDDEIVELFQQHLPEGGAGGFGQLVGAILGDAAGDFFTAQALLRGGSQLMEDLLRIQGVPGRGGSNWLVGGYRFGGHTISMKWA